jgi:hypothetical protein
MRLSHSKETEGLCATREVVTHGSLVGLCHRGKGFTNLRVIIRVDEETLTSYQMESEDTSMGMPRVESVEEMELTSYISILSPNRTCVIFVSLFENSEGLRQDELPVMILGFREYYISRYMSWHSVRMCSMRSKDKKEDANNAREPAEVLSGLAK